MVTTFSIAIIKSGKLEPLVNSHIQREKPYFISYTSVS